MGLEAGGHCRLRGGSEWFQLRDCYQVYTLQLCKLQPRSGSGKRHPDFYTALSLSASHGREPLTGPTVPELQHTGRLLQPSEEHRANFTLRSLQL